MISKNIHFQALTEFLRLRTNLDRILSPVAAQFGLTPLQSVMLHLISQSEETTVGSLFRELDLNQGNVSSVCKKLECDGYITRNKSQRDERIYVISLTVKGKDTIRKMEDELLCCLPECTEKTRKELERAVEGLAAIKTFAENLNAAIAEKQRSTENA